MTNEDKKIVADYMNWKVSDDNIYFAITDNGRNVYYNLNDASLCVQEMQKRGDWNRFLNHGFNSLIDVYGFMAHNFIATLFRADNFFSAFVEWRKGK